MGFSERYIDYFTLAPTIQGAFHLLLHIAAKEDSRSDI
jgi:hypothetical protein